MHLAIDKFVSSCIILEPMQFAKDCSMCSAVVVLLRSFLTEWFGEMKPFATICF